MKKILFTLTMTSFLVACTNNDISEENVYVSPNYRPVQVEVVPPASVQVQPDEFIEALQTIKDTPATAKQVETEGYMEYLAKKLRKELRSTGVKVVEEEGQINLLIPYRISFGNSQKKILPTFASNLSSIVALLKEYDKTMIQITGYTDDTSSVLISKEESLQKADEIAKFLRDQGIESERIITFGAGPDNPVSTNTTSIGREQNRRIEMTLISIQ